MSTTPERILVAATAVFSEHGYDGASSRMLAAAAKVNVATLAYHFGGKEGLYEAVVGQVYSDLFTLALPTDLPELASERVRCVMDTLFDFALDHRQGLRLLLRHVLETRRLPQQVHDHWAAALLGRLGELETALGPQAQALDPLAVATLNHLLVRYAISEPEDLAPFTGAQDPRAAVRRHLGDVACLLLGVA